MPEAHDTENFGIFGEHCVKEKMFGEGKEQLRTFIRNKRAHEGLQDIPDDLFAKKPRHEMSEEEYQGMMERRKRNKEAAERSRKKKKVEFEKLQSENDQLNQDKCELVAMVQKLEKDIEASNRERELLCGQLEHLKRWIGKRSFELGLTKFAPSEAQNKSAEAELASAPAAHGKPPKEENGQPASRPQLQLPWCVESFPGGKEKPAPEGHTGGVAQSFPQPAHVPENHPQFMVTNGQPIVYLPKDAVIVIQGENGTLRTGTPEPRPMRRASPKLAVEPPEAPSSEIPWMSKASLSGSFGREEEARGASVRDITSGMDPAKATAIESLLKLGCKIQLPESSRDLIPGRTCEVPEVSPTMVTPGGEGMMTASLRKQAMRTGSMMA